MQQEQIILPSGNTVRTPGGNHYIIEGLLGKGGFGAVYLVRDRYDEQKLYALKEVIDPSEQDRVRFTTEAELLKRLHHKALPRIYDVFENEKLRRVYILMDYVKGRDLEALLAEQPEQLFDLPLAVTIMEPVVQAIIYMHHQQPPIVHRDIKPANIIVPLTGEQAVLVDFGLAKEYIVGKTTTMIRHGSPGYAAMEQYGHSGTTPRTDIYGLAATLYTLLTGVVPTDPVTRVTENGDFDSLTPASLLNPTLPTATAKAIHRAMSISERDRFATVEEFWHEITMGIIDQRNGMQSVPAYEVMTTPVPLPQPLTVVEQKLHPVTSELVLNRQRRLHLPSKKSRILFSVAILLLLTGIIGGSIVFNATRPGVTASPTPQTRIHATAKSHPSAQETTSLYPQLVSHYGGTIADIMTNETTPMFLTNVQQSQGSLQGVFNGLGLAGRFTGTVTETGRVQFHITIQQGNSVLAFTGDIKVGGDIVGSFQVLDQQGQPTGDSGVWNLAPNT